MSEGAHSNDGETGGVSETIRDIADAGVERVEEAVEESREVVRKNPLAATIIAAGVGAALGFYLARSLSKR